MLSMKISTRGRYALRVMIDLGTHQSSGNISLKDISSRQDISMKYLEQIMPALTRAGIVRGARGARGGYSLSKSLNQYTPKDIIEVVEGPIACVSCLETDKNNCPRYNQCPTISLYEGLNKVIIEYLESYTLQDLADSIDLDNWDYII